jgi:exopolysaccharide production protein ExoZ
VRNLSSVQHLRGLAALMVVFHHSRNPQAWLYNPIENFDLGHIGVDIFFVISGFIMYSVAKTESAPEFVRRRLLRVVPMYWLATIVLLAVNVNWHIEKLTNARVGHIALSLFFVPHYSPDEPGRIWPYLIPGWTLSYEMFFYLIFAIGIAARRPFALTSICLGAIVLCGWEFSISAAAWKTYTDPIVLEFVMGMVIAANVHRVSAGGAALLVCMGILAVPAVELLGLPRVRLLTLGVPAACIVAGAIALEMRKPIPRLPWLSALGDASYSIYLFQIVALGLVSKAFKHIPVAGMLQFVAFVVTSLVFASVLGYTVYRFIEKPMLRRYARRRILQPLEAQAVP